MRGLDAEWKLLRRPIKHYLPNLTPLWANRNLGANRSDGVSGRILKRNVKITVRFNFEGNYAACESEPFSFNPSAL